MTTSPSPTPDHAINSPLPEAEVVDFWGRTWDEWRPRGRRLPSSPRAAWVRPATRGGRDPLVEAEARSRAHAHMVEPDRTPVIDPLAWTRLHRTGRERSCRGRVRPSRPGTVTVRGESAPGAPGRDVEPNVVELRRRHRSATVFTNAPAADGSRFRCWRRHRQSRELRRLAGSKPGRLVGEHTCDCHEHGGKASARVSSGVDELESPPAVATPPAAFSRDVERHRRLRTRRPARRITSARFRDTTCRDRHQWNARSRGPRRRHRPTRGSSRSV